MMDNTVTRPSAAPVSQAYLSDSHLGLIRYGIVIHAFVDGKSHLVTGIQANNNNRGMTVLVLFHRCRSKHGTPSRVRGDHGTENLRVAQWMLAHRGTGRGSYIFGRYVSTSLGEWPTFDRFGAAAGVSITLALNTYGSTSPMTSAKSGKIFF